MAPVGIQAFLPSVPAHPAPRSPASCRDSGPRQMCGWRGSQSSFTTRSASQVRPSGVEGADKGVSAELGGAGLGWGNRADERTEEGQHPGSASAAQRMIDRFSAPRRALVTAEGFPLSKRPETIHFSLSYR